MPKYIELEQLHRKTTQDSRILELEAEVQHLQKVVRYQANMIAELQCRVDPYSQDGEALYNSFWLKGMD